MPDSRRRSTLPDWVFVVAIVLTGSVVAAQKPVEKLQLRPDPQIQAAIERLGSVMNAKEIQERLNELKTIGGRSYVKLIPQLLYYSCYRDNRQEGDWAAFGALAQLLEISDISIISALVPYLDADGSNLKIGASDKTLKAQVKDVLGGIERRSFFRPPDFTCYVGVMRVPLSAGRLPPTGLVDHVYDTHAGTALLTMLSLFTRDIQQRREILWAEHVVRDFRWKKKHKFQQAAEKALPNAADQLEKLARHELWWARRYVAAIMQQEPTLRDDRIIRLLRHDEHPLVKKAMLVVEGIPSLRRK